LNVPPTLPGADEAIEMTICANVAYWHFSAVPTEPSNVGY
jgi:hypothetical protein